MNFCSPDLYQWRVANLEFHPAQAGDAMAERVSWVFPSGTRCSSRLINATLSSDNELPLKRVSGDHRKSLDFYSHLEERLEKFLFLPAWKVSEET